MIYHSTVCACACPGTIVVEQQQLITKRTKSMKRKEGGKAALCTNYSTEIIIYRTVFENHRTNIIQNCERSELSFNLSGLD